MYVLMPCMFLGHLRAIQVNIIALMSAHTHTRLGPSPSCRAWAYACCKCMASLYRRHGEFCKNVKKIIQTSSFEPFCSINSYCLKFLTINGQDTLLLKFI